MNFLVRAWIPLLLTTLSMGASVFFFLAAVRRKRDVELKAQNLINLVASGRMEEARIQARVEARVLRPILLVLGGSLEIPNKFSRLDDLVGWVGVIIPFGVFLLYGFFVLPDPHVEYRVELATVFFFGLGVLLPTMVATCVGLFALGSEIRRIARGACIAVLIRSVSEH